MTRRSGSWVAGHRAGEASAVQTVSTDRRGGFSVDVPRSLRADDVLYATATGGRSGLHETVPTLGDPYGDGLAVFLGAAAPIAMRLVGTPK